MVMSNPEGDVLYYCTLSLIYSWRLPFLIQASFKWGHEPPPLSLDVVSSPDNGRSDGTFTHSIAHAGKQVSVKALRQGDHLFVYISPSHIAELSKEWYVIVVCVCVTGKVCILVCIYVLD